MAEVEEEATCPFNYFYRDFITRNRAHFEGNWRMGVVLKTLDRMTDEKMEAVRSDAKRFPSTL